MKREYQKETSTEMVRPEEQAVQIELPMAEILTSLEEGLGERPDTCRCFVYFWP